MYSEEHEDPLYTKLSKILELTSLIFGHYKDTGQKERAHSLIVSKCVKSEELYSVSSIGMLPFIEGSLGDSTSGLVASSRDSEEHA